MSNNNYFIDDIIEVFNKYGNLSDLVCDEDILCFLSFLSIIEPASKKDITKEFDISNEDFSSLITKLLKEELIFIDNRNQLFISETGENLLKSLKLHKLKLRDLQGEVLRKEQDAFINLVERFKKKVYLLSYDIVGDRNLAEDITQETFFKVYRSLGSFRKDAKMSSWIYHIAVNTSIDYLRKEKKQRHAQLSEEDKNLKEKYFINITLQEKDAHIEKLQEQIREALQKISPRERSVFVMQHYGDLKISEIADVLGVTSGTVKSMLSRALKNYKENISELIAEFKYSG